MGKRYYAKNGSLFANSDYNPQEVIVNDFSELVKITDRLEPGAIGRVVGRKQSYELNTDRVWISETGVPFITDEESEELDGGYVQFIDYDGTMIAKVKGKDVANMTKLPANPEHKGLVSQGWNWELDRIKYYIAKYPEAIMTVGQMYCTADGATHMVIHIDQELTLPLVFQQTVSEGVTIDWGDRSPLEKIEGTDTVTTSHTYTIEGDYIISFIVSEDCELKFGGLIDNNTHNIFGEYTNFKHTVNVLKELYVGKGVNGIRQNAFRYCNILKYITIPKDVTNIQQFAFNNCNNLIALILPERITFIGQGAFNGCNNLTFLSIPDGTDITISLGAFNSCYALSSLIIPEGIINGNQVVFGYCYKLAFLTICEGITNIDTNMFGNCSILSSLIIPKGVTNIGQNAFNGCKNISSLIIPNDVTNIGQNAFASCYKLESIIIPKNVTSIGQTAFDCCWNLTTMVLEPITPPSLVNSNAFRYISSDCVIYVPYSEDHSILTAYQEATNWSTWAEQMVEMEPEEELDEPEETPTEP